MSVEYLEIFKFLSGFHLFSETRERWIGETLDYQVKISRVARLCSYHPNRQKVVVFFSYYSKVYQTSSTQTQLQFLLKRFE